MAGFKKKSALTTIAFFAAFSSFFALLVLQPAERVGPEDENFTAALISVDGKDLKCLTRGRCQLIFFSPGCARCLTLFDQLKRVKDAGGARAIAIGDGSRNEIIAFRRDHRLTIPFVSDPDGKLFKKFAVFSVPFRLFLDRGKILRAAGE